MHVTWLSEDSRITNINTVIDMIWQLLEKRQYDRIHAWVGYDLHEYISSLPSRSNLQQCKAYTNTDNEQGYEMHRICIDISWLVDGLNSHRQYPCIICHPAQIHGSVKHTRRQTTSNDMRCIDSLSLSRDLSTATRAIDYTDTSLLYEQINQRIRLTTVCRFLLIYDGLSCIRIDGLRLMAWWRNGE